MRTHNTRGAAAATCLCIVQAAAIAQPASLTGGTQPPLNGYAENLRPKAGRGTAPNKLYEPIRRQDDQGLVPEIEMFVGESRVFPTPGVGRIAVGNGQILTAAALDNREVILFANAVGTSSLFVWNEDGRYQRIKVNIVPGDTSRFAREIATFLTAIPNARASVIGDKVIVEGDRLADLDIAKIDELAKRYPQIVNFTNRLGWEQMVLMDVKVVEFPTNELRELGLKWGTSGGVAAGGVWSPLRRGSQAGLQVNVPGTQAVSSADGTPNVVLPSGLNLLTALNLGIHAQLNLLAQEGKATVLAQPQLSARNGSKATFLAGGEYPYTVSTINGPTVLFKPYGVKLDIVPRVDTHGAIRATVDSEVSTIDTSVSTPAGPALLTRKTSTEFNVASGETLVLAGLISRRTSNSVDKLPLLGDVPVLGQLFRSRRFQNDETELVVFVTPTVIDSRSPELVDRVAGTAQRLAHEAGKPPFLAVPVPRIEATPATPAPASFAAPTPVPRARTGSSLQVMEEGLVLRAQANAKSTALMHLGRGAIVTMTGTDAPEGEDPVAWREVLVGTLTGWVQATGVRPASIAASTTTNRPSSLIANTDREGQDLSIGHSKPANGNPGASQATASATPLRVVLEGLALRVTPDVNAQIVQRLAYGAVMTETQPPRGLWSAVRTADGQQGWVATQWLSRTP